MRLFEQKFIICTVNICNKEYLYNDSRNICCFDEKINNNATKHENAIRYAFESQIKFIINVYYVWLMWWIIYQLLFASHRYLLHCTQYDHFHVRRSNLIIFYFLFLSRFLYLSLSVLIVIYFILCKMKCWPHCCYSYKIYFRICCNVKFFTVYEMHKKREREREIERVWPFK